MSCLGIKVYNNLPSCINDKTDNQKLQNQFKKLFILTLFLLCKKFFFKSNLLEVLKLTQPSIGLY